MEITEKEELIYSQKLNKKNKKKSVEHLENKLGKVEKNSRYFLFDNYKGILIFTVVFAHFLWKYGRYNRKSLSRKIVEFIYCFHMSGFIFISGFLSSENSTKISNAIKLLILYYIFNFSFILIIYFYINAKIEFLYPKYSYWYLLSLFCWRISIKYIYNLYFIFTLSIIISLLIGYWSCFSNVLSVVRTIGFFPYFILGYKISKSGKFNTLLQWRKGFFKFITFFICFLFFLFKFLRYIKENRIPNNALLFFSYSRYSTIKIRINIFIISFGMILFAILLIPNKVIPIINKWGTNSMYIYLFHRIFTIIADNSIFNNRKYSNYIIELSILFTFIILFIFSSNFVNKNCNYILNSIHKNLLELNPKGKLIAFLFCISFICLLLINPISNYINIKKSNLKIIKRKYRDINTNKINHIINKENINITDIKEKLNNSIRISYIGDLILLKDQVIVAKNNTTGKYEFDEMFKYTSKHFHESDYTIGIYEGPSAGNNTSYSTSNYGDGIPLYLNFPDEFIESIKKAGINLVSTANNHLLDKNIEGAIRTIDILDKYNISHVGSYRNKEEKEKIFITNIKGIKLAILSYTSKMNYYKIDTLYEKYKYLTGYVPNKIYNKYYNEIYDDIKNDFIKAKKYLPDIIIVLNHIGSQFLHHTIKFQDEWNNIFINLGADIILNDHSHSLQPIQYINNTIIVNSPGNFANSYIEKDGDSTAIIDIYINKQIKKVIGTSVIPMYTKEIRPKYFSAIPIYDLINDKSIILTEKEKKRIEEIQLMSTKILLGKEIGINEVKKHYFFINNSYYDLDNLNKSENNFCDILNKYSNSEIYKYLFNSNSITFIGDSITEGTKNGYHPWYEPMTKCFNNKKIINISKGSYTTKLILKHFKNDIIQSNSDLYIIALGTNDIRYKGNFCASDSKDYVYQMEQIVNLAKTENENAKFIFIAPWFSTDDDKIFKLYHKNKTDKTIRMKEYSLKIENFAKINNYIYIDPNEYLEKIVLENKNKYMVDYIHPNSFYGIELYCESIFKVGK